MSPAGAWFLDNFFVVLEQVREIRATLPSGYYHELPKLSEGPLAGYPRVYDIVLEFIAHTDGRLSLPSIERVVREYQTIAPLTMGELWAIPAMLRMGFLENIRRMALVAVRDLNDRVRADEWVARVLGAPADAELSATLMTFVHHSPHLSPTFVTRFLQQIRSRRSDFTPLLWLEQWVADEYMPIEEAAQQSTQEQALTQLVMANSIVSLRAVGSIDWNAFVEASSTTEAVLRRDPAGVYPTMTTTTRDRYRHVVEHIAKETEAPEPQVANACVELAEAGAATNGRESRFAHVGYYLVGEGRHEFEQAMGYRAPGWARVSEWVLAHPGGAYFGALGVVVMTILLLLAQPLDGASIGWIVTFVLLAFLPASDAAIAIVNQIAMLIVPPARLTRLDYQHGVPEQDRTVVVVPLLLGSVDAVDDALKHLEAQYLANRDAEIRFAILSDFTDAPTETTESDDAIVETALAGIRALNEAHGTPLKEGVGGVRTAPFYLFHRRRLWNPADAVWMGWERKRGKLVEFNAFASGINDHSFAIAEGDMGWLLGVRYVITLDADTQLPRDAAAALIGTMAHPLNRAEYDAERGRVVRGYGILQPRVSVSLASANESRFAAIYAGHPGVDPYTTAVSDVYQDLFGEGTFTGKGIYDLEVFRQSTAGRFPDNTLLSHDLIEGTFARAGLVTDVEVFDDYPTRYLTSTRRLHRWIRGDWQLLPYLARRIPGPNGRTPNPLTGLSRWKIVDNMRRSASPIALLAWLVAGWTFLPGAGLAWTVAALGTFSIQWAAALLVAAARPPRRQSWRPYYASLGHDASSAGMQFVLAVALLPDQALLAADAIVRSLVRMLMTRRRLLEWQTASQVERATSFGRGSVWRRMWPSVALAVIVMLLVVWDVQRDAPGYAADWLLPFAALTLTTAWLTAPEIALALSAPRLRTDLHLSNSERTAALRYALQHWRYFERFVTADTHWLVPDNFQETPDPVIASRTSPTNMGLQLLSTMSACDLGFLTRGEMLDQLERALDSMDKLTRVHGHFLNWYDLNDLRVLDPPYISTVDSGNLAGHLIALAEGCLQAIDKPVDDGRLWASLEAEESAKRERRRRFGVADTEWIGERLVAYQKAELTLRRHASTAPEAKDEEASDELWARQRLEATVAELTQMGLEPDVEAATSLRTAATMSPGATTLVARLEAIAARAIRVAMEMDFSILFEPNRKLLAIGYDARSGCLDEAAYDLLASESRLASFMAVAKGDIAAEHWFRLGRSLTNADGATALVSWSGSMFEYLMPLLVMPTRPFSLLDQTCHAAVRRQISYGHLRKVPWGISESAYNVRDRHDTYQYRAFGVPDLALKRGLAGDLVIAPYATILAAMIDPHKALNNLVALEREQALGAYGFYDALDYTHLGPDESMAVVRAYMAHHIGMSIVALDNALSVTKGNSDGVWPRRFMNAAVVRAAALLLDERVPRRYLAQPAQSDAREESSSQSVRAQNYLHEVGTADTAEPHVALLGGIPYSVLLTNAGSGYSRANGMDVMRWRADGTRDDTGQWIYVRDTSSDAMWSVAHQPTHVQADVYTVAFSTDRVVFDRRDGLIETRTEVVVIPSEQAEVRRVTLVNRSRTPRELELTSYGEVVLSDPDADRAHPAFQKLFVQTEWVPERGALLASRRPRSADEPRPWCAHVVATGPERVGKVTHETDRAQFLGRGRTVRAPRALDADSPLSGTVGAVLDPIVALRVRVRIEPGRSATIAFTTAVAGTRDAAVQLADRYRDLGAAERALSLSSTEARVELNDLDIEPHDAGLYQQLASALIYPHEAFRAPEHERAANRRGQSALWAQGISGDWPIVLATIRGEAGLASVRQLLAAHKYWRMKGVRSDLVILNAKTHSYARELHDQLVAMAMASSEGGVIERPGGVFIRRADMLSKEDATLLRATASIHFICDGVGLGEIVAANIIRQAAEPSVGTTAEHVARARVSGSTTAVAESNVPALANGYGALTDGGDYGISVAGDSVPPAPWSNVIANPNAGFCVTERGGGFMWVENSHFFRLTPWFNDPVSDPCGDVLYLQDAVSGQYWTPTPGPAPACGIPGDSAAYGVRHAPGVTTFVHEHGGIGTELAVAVPIADPLKISRLRITNRGRQPRKLTLTSYVEWALGAERERTSQRLHTRRDDASGALFAQNFFAPDFASHVAFSWISEPVASHTSRRDEFVGRNGDLTSPAALSRPTLSGASGAGYDPCAAMRCTITLAPGETRDVITLLGAAASDDEARAMIARYAVPGAASAALDEAVKAWNDRLSVITVRTPDSDFDAMLNRWSLYQALSCRMWARSAIYQSSGAYGFRDQLQDCMAFLYATPEVSRAHILRAAAHQFVEGDVQHWWHEPSGRGVRTRFSDDLAWLPFVADQYVNVTGDVGLWDEVSPYLQMRLLNPNEHEVYDLPVVSDVSESVYAHCVRALDRACTSGVHGLPLMGSGDWNDGMNRVGVKGTGESIWLAWFLVATLRRFAVHATARGDTAVAERFRARADAYAAAVERDGWDGNWYLRAYYDDGTPLGSARNEECQIDAIAQSWSVISGAADSTRAHTAMQSVYDRLVRDDARLVMLLTPPFDKTDRDPGYIKGYVPGVRENGAQYTHAAFWTALAAAKLGDGNRAADLLGMLNPLTRTRTRADADTYKVEPYAVSADVYAAEGHVGRGGWTWYTGSAGWSYRVGLEGLLGFEKRGDTLTMNPCVPTSWPEFTVEYRHRTSHYSIVVRNPEGVSRGVRAVEVDGVPAANGVIALTDDGARHAVVITLG